VFASIPEPRSEVNELAEHPVSISHDPRLWVKKVRGQKGNNTRVRAPLAGARAKPMRTHDPARQVLARCLGGTRVRWEQFRDRTNGIGQVYLSIYSHGRVSRDSHDIGGEKGEEGRL